MIITENFCAINLFFIFIDFFVKTHNIVSDYILTHKIMAQDALGMRGNRSRNQDGRLRDKRDDTHMGTIEKQYGKDFEVRSDMHLGTYLKKNDINSLNDLINGD